MRPSLPVRHFWALRNRRFFCSFLRSALLVERLGIATRFTPRAWAAASLGPEKNPASAVTKRGVRPNGCSWASITAVEAGGCHPATPRPHAVTSIAGISGSFCYDLNGNLTSGNALSLSWTAFDQPAQITKDAANYDQFSYGPEHQRVTHTQVANAVTTAFYYAGAMERLAGASAALRTYLPFGLGVVVDTGTAPRTVSYFHRDHLGSTVAVTNAAGAYLEGFAYDPWGKRRNPHGSDAGSLPASSDRYGYTGQEMLDVTGLVHLNGRVYDPLLGRFQAADPYVTQWAQTQGHNRFAYVLNSPLNATDPSGYASRDLLAAQGG